MTIDQTKAFIQEIRNLKQNEYLILTAAKTISHSPTKQPNFTTQRIAEMANSCFTVLQTQLQHEPNSLESLPKLKESYNDFTQLQAGLMNYAARVIQSIQSRWWYCIATCFGYKAKPPTAITALNTKIETTLTTLRSQIPSDIAPPAPPEHRPWDECQKVVEKCIANVNAQLLEEEAKEKGAVDEYCFSKVNEYFISISFGPSMRMTEPNYFYNTPGVLEMNSRYHSARYDLTNIFEKRGLFREITDDHVQKTIRYMRLILTELQRNDQIALDTIADNVAVAHMDSAYMQTLTKKCIDIDPVFMICKYAKQPSEQQFYMAAIAERNEMLLACLKKGFDPKSPGNVTPFHIALINDNIPLAKMLLEHTRQPIDQLEPHIDHSNNPLLKLAQSIEAVHFLLNSPKNLELQFHSKVEGRSPVLHFLYYNFDIFMILIEKKPELFQEKNCHGSKIIELLYERAKNKEEDAKQFREICHRFHPVLSELILADMRRRVELGEVNWKQYLTNSQEVQPSVIWHLSEEDTMKTCQRQTGVLKNLLRLHNLNPESIPLDVIEQAYQLKRHAKKVCKDRLNEAWYREFVDVYDRIVERQPILRALRCVSREIRRPKDSSYYQSNYAMKFTSIWETALKTPFERAAVRNRIAKAHTDVQKMPLHMRVMILVHGTNSSGIAIMDHLGGLEAAGTIMGQGYGLLSGEASSAIDGNNRTAISTMFPDTQWEQPNSPLIGGFIQSRYQISKTYSTRNSENIYGNHRQMNFSLEHEYKVLREKISKLDQADVKNIYFWFDLKRAILNLRMVDPDFSKNTEAERQALEKYSPSFIGKDYSARLECLTAWTQKPPMRLDLKDPLMTDPIPALFASHSYEYSGQQATINTRQAQKYDNYRPNLHSELLRATEVFVERPLQFGEDLQYVFTHPHEVQKLHKVFQKYHMDVYSFDVGGYLATRQLDYGAKYVFTTQDKEALLAYACVRYPNMTKEEIQKELSVWIYESEFHQNVAYDFVMIRTVSTAFHRNALPYYASLVPETQVKPDGTSNRQDYGKHEDYSRITRAEYLHAVNDGSGLPREHHGPMHGARAMLYGFMLSELYTIAKKPLTVPSYYIALAAGYHDTGRQCNFDLDEWDSDSARNLRRHMHGTLNHDVITILSNAIQHKDIRDDHTLSDAEKTKIKTNELEVVHDTDCLEYHRVLANKAYFDQDRLYFPSLEAFPRPALIKEVALFIELTNTFPVQKWMHDNSADYFGDVARIFKHLHQQKGCFPLMSKLLEPTLTALSVDHAVLPNELQLLFARK